MKTNTNNWLNGLSPEQRKEIDRITAEAERQSDEYMQRVCSPFGYKHGNYWAMIAWSFTALFAAVAGVVGFALFAPTQEIAFQTKINILLGIATVPCLIIPILLFVFLKARYAFRVLGVLIVVVVIGQLLFGMIDPLLHFAVDALLES